MKKSSRFNRAALPSLFVSLIFAFPALFLAVSSAQPAQTAQKALLVLNKSDSTLAIIDPSTLRVVGRVPTGEAPHEVIASADGRFAFVSNYGTGPTPGNTLSVIDIAARKEVSVSI